MHKMQTVNQTLIDIENQQTNEKYFNFIAQQFFINTDPKFLSFSVMEYINGERLSTALESVFYNLTPEQNKILNLHRYIILELAYIGYIQQDLQETNFLIYPEKIGLVSGEILQEIMGVIIDFQEIIKFDLGSGFICDWNTETIEKNLRSLPRLTGKSAESLRLFDLTKEDLKIIQDIKFQKTLLEENVTQTPDDFCKNISEFEKTEIDQIHIKYEASRQDAIKLMEELSY